MHSPRVAMGQIQKHPESGIEWRFLQEFFKLFDVALISKNGRENSMVKSLKRPLILLEACEPHLLHENAFESLRVHYIFQNQIPFIAFQSFQNWKNENKILEVDQKVKSVKKFEKRSWVVLYQ